MIDELRNLHELRWVAKDLGQAAVSGTARGMGFIAGTVLKKGLQAMANKNTNAKTDDDVTLTISVHYRIPKQDRVEGYEFPNIVAADCLRQDLERYKNGEIMLADLLFSPYVHSRTIQVTHR